MRHPAQGASLCLLLRCRPQIHGKGGSALPKFPGLLDDANFGMGLDMNEQMAVVGAPGLGGMAGWFDHLSEFRIILGLCRHSASICTAEPKLGYSGSDCRKRSLDGKPGSCVSVSGIGRECH